MLTPVLLNMEFAQASTTVAEESGIVSIPLVIHNKATLLSLQAGSGINVYRQAALTALRSDCRR